MSLPVSVSALARLLAAAEGYRAVVEAARPLRPELRQAAETVAFRAFVGECRRERVTGRAVATLATVLHGLCAAAEGERYCASPEAWHDAADSLDALLGPARVYRASIDLARRLPADERQRVGTVAFERLVRECRALKVEQPTILLLAETLYGLCVATDDRLAPADWQDACNHAEDAAGHIARALRDSAEQARAA